MLWRLLKFAGLVALAGGVFGTVAAPTRRLRLTMTYGYAVPGFVVTWAAGWMLMRATNRSPLDPWILATIAASLISIHATFLSSHLERPRPVWIVLAVAGLMVAVATMVIRSSQPADLVVGLVAGTVVGALLAWPFSRRGVVTSLDDAQVTWRGFQWLAWAEGGSLFGLVCVAMPLKYGFGIYLDGGTGLFGWGHGVLAIVYLQTLLSGSRMLDLSKGQSIQAAIAAFIPAGPLVIERRIARARSEATG